MPMESDKKRGLGKGCEEVAGCRCQLVMWVKDLLLVSKALGVESRTLEPFILFLSVKESNQRVLLESVSQFT